MTFADRQKRGGGDRRLLAALAVMAVAFVSLAVCATFDSPDSDADASTGYITVEGVAGANERYDSFDQLYTDLKSKLKTALGNGNDDAIYVEQTVSADKFKAFFTDNSMGTANDYDAKITYTVHGTVEYDEKDHSYLLSLGRAADFFAHFSRYFPFFSPAHALFLTPYALLFYNDKKACRLHPAAHFQNLQALFSVRCAQIRPRSDSACAFACTPPVCTGLCPTACRFAAEPKGELF